MDSNYHIFKKPVKSKDKIIHRWYYYFFDPVTGKKIQKVCKNCKTQAQANAFISTLPPLFVEKKVTLNDICEWMYFPGGPHLERMAKLGKVWSIDTIKDKHRMLELFLENFGELELKDITIPMITEFLADINRSGGWKNNFLTVVREIYAEAPFHGIPYIPCPAFPNFIRNSKKKSLFTKEELKMLFNESLWIRFNEERYRKFPQFNEGHSSMYLMFLVIANCGLRIGEGIAIKVKQFHFDEKVLVVDGFMRRNTLKRTNYNKCGSEDNQKIRVAPLPDEILRIIQAYIKKHNLGPEDYVFQRYGKPIRAWLAEEWFRKIIRMTDINVGKRILTPHSLRFTYITRLRQDVAGETVQKIAGHTSLNMTDYYTIPDISDLVEAVQPAAGAVNRLFA